jgi:glycerate kinase
MKIIIAPDKFKGSLTSFEVCRAISNGIKKADKEIDVSTFPMADGGDGFAAVMKYYVQTETIYCTTVDPLGQKISVSYEWNAESKTAIIETAVASGLVLLKEEERNPLLTSTLGTGLLIKLAIDKGATKIILGLGGSATNDGGTGILSALGFQFFDKDGLELKANGANLLLIKEIITPSSIADIKFQIASDVENLLYGLKGAAYIYAPQKGADKKQVELLDEGLKNFAAIIKHQTGKDVASVRGSGAAGGIAAGLLAFYDTEIKKGTDIVIEAAKIENKLTGVDLIITGEGKIDEQSSQGKVIGSISALAKKYDIPCIAVCGISDLDEMKTTTMGFKKVIALTDQSTRIEDAIKNAFQLLEEKAIRILSLF